MIRNVEKAKNISDVQPKVATLGRLYLEYAKGFNESKDEDIKGVKDKFIGMPIMGYLDVFEKSDLIRILPDAVIKDLRRSPNINLENTSYDNLLKTVQQLVQDSSNGAVPMELDALRRCEEDEETGDDDVKEKEHGQKYPEAAEGGPREKDDDELIPRYWHHGSIHYISSKNNRGKNGKNWGGKGDGKASKGLNLKEIFDGTCAWCNKYGHRLRDCRSYTAHLQKGGEPTGSGKQWAVKGDGKVGKGKGKTGHHMNYIGNEYAPMPIQLNHQQIPPHPQLMAAPWEAQFMGSLCCVETKNAFSELSIHEEQDEEDEHSKYEVAFPKLGEFRVRLDIRKNDYIWRKGDI